MSKLSMCLEVSSPRIIRKKKIIKPKGKGIKPPSVLDQIYHTRNQSNSLHYFTKAKSVNPSEARNVLKEPSPFECLIDRNIYAFDAMQNAWKSRIQKEQLQKKCHEKTTLKQKHNADILKRAYIPDEEKSSEKTLLDLDPEFYSIVDERKRRINTSLSNYKDIMNNLIRTQLIVGLQKDEVLLLEQKMQKERKLINEAHENFKKYHNSFETFLNNDYEESINLIQKVDMYTKTIMDINAEIQELHAENAAIEFEVHKLEEHWRDLKMYQKFFYFISPLSWRQKYDYIHRNKVTNELNTEPGTLFKKYTLDSEGNIPPLIQLLDEYFQIQQTEQEPRLYFSSPNELQKIFNFIQLQNLNCLLHTEEIIVTMENMEKSMDDIEFKFEKENSRIDAIISKLQEGIEWEEKRANQLKDTAMKLIDGKFKELVCDEVLLRFYVCVEDVYYMCTKKNDGGMNLDEMMKTIEQHYNMLILRLDSLPQDVVENAQQEHVRHTTYLHNLVKDTAQKIDLVDKITWRLRKSLEPPYQKVGKELKWRSAPPAKRIKPKPPARELTDSEKEYLEYFTTYCQYTDKVENYGIDLNKPEGHFKKFF